MDGGANFGGGMPQQPVPPAGIPYREAMISDRPGWLARLLGAKFREDRGYRMKWGEFSWKWGIAFDLINWEEERDWSLHLQTIYGNAYIKLPFLPKRTPPSLEHLEHWGFCWTWDVDNRGADIHCHWGERTKIVHLPWHPGSAVRWDMLCADGVWRKIVHSYNRKEGDPEPATEVHPYRYVKRDGTVQNVNAVIHVREMEWRWAIVRLLQLPLRGHVIRSIDIEFTSDEAGFDGVGERAGSWKGGTIGCGYEMRRGETPLECLRRMQRDRKF